MLVVAVVVVVLVMRAAAAGGRSGGRSGGTARPARPQAQRPVRPLAPDDDPEFLRELERRARRDDASPPGSSAGRGAPRPAETPTAACRWCGPAQPPRALGRGRPVDRSLTLGDVRGQVRSTVHAGMEARACDVRHPGLGTTLTERDAE